MRILIKVEDGENIYKKESLGFESAAEDIYKLQRAVEARRDKEFQELDLESEFVYPESYWVLPPAVPAE